MQSDLQHVPHELGRVSLDSAVCTVAAECHGNEHLLPAFTPDCSDAGRMETPNVTVWSSAGASDMILQLLQVVLKLYLCFPYILYCIGTLSSTELTRAS